MNYIGDNDWLDYRQLQHYGVLGMKWGVRRSEQKAAQNRRLEKRALKYDEKAAKLASRAEKVHSKYDLSVANRGIKRVAKLDAKAAKTSNEALNAKTDAKRAKLERQSETYRHKAAKARIVVDTIQKGKGYGTVAAALAVKSAKVSIKAEKARRHIANNDVYITMMQRRVSELS